MDKEAIKKAAVLTAGRDQAMAFIRDNQQTIAAYAVGHPDDLIRALAGFSLAELKCCPDVKFVELEDDAVDE